MMSTILLYLYLFIIASTIVLVLLENRDPLKALSWVIILLVLPVAGLLAYLVFGRDTRRYRIISKNSYNRIMRSSCVELPVNNRSSVELADAGSKVLSDLIKRQTANELLVADSVEIFVDGANKFASLLEDLRSAKEHIHLEYYVFRDDALGREVADLLIAKAQEGVVVRLLYDYVGSYTTPRRFFRQLRAGGVEVYSFLPVVFPFFTSQVNYRNHRKVVVIDGTIGYVGGMNVGEYYRVGNHLGPWRDTHFRISGRAVNGLQAAFMVDWYVASRRILPEKLYYAEAKRPVAAQNSVSAKMSGSKEVILQTFTSGPTGSFRVLLHVLCRAIDSATKSVRIQTPYFLPNESLNRAIIGAALSGVEVELLLPWKSDALFVGEAARSYFEELLQAGVKVRRYLGGFLHSKIVTIDGRISIVGSANMDFRSLEHNFEVTTLLYSAESTEEIERIMDRDNLSSEVIELHQWQRRPLYEKLIESICRLFSPLM